MAQPSAFSQAISRNVRQLAAGDKITRQQIGEAIGLDVGSVSRRLNGHAEFSTTELEQIAPLFNMPPAELIPRK